MCGALIEAEQAYVISALEGKRPGYIYGLTHTELKGIYSAFFCQECIADLEEIGASSCSRCGKALSHENAKRGLCSDCSEKIRLFEKCICVFNYNKYARDMAAAFKYNYRRDRLKALSFALAARLAYEFRRERPDAIIPVPIHGKRLRERGYNQAELIADTVGHALGIPVVKDVLVRNENTKAQKELCKNQRILNLQQAFETSADTVCPEKVLVIDDIYTTGATLEACTEALLHAGAKRVYGACIFAGQDR